VLKNSKHVYYDKERNTFLVLTFMGAGNFVLYDMDTNTLHKLAYIGKL
jgi:hypothetical protein